MGNISIRTVEVMKHSGETWFPKRAADMIRVARALFVWMLPPNHSLQPTAPSLTWSQQMSSRPLGAVE